MQQEPVFKPLRAEDCTPNLLDGFNRCQQVTKSWRKKNGEWVLAPTPFVEQWDTGEKHGIIQDCKAMLEAGGTAVGCFIDGAMVGWCCTGGKLFGSAGQYVNLAYLHVSNEYRGRGIGKQLFRYAAAAGRQLGAEKLYISAMSAMETQAFYKGLGCREAQEVDPVLFEKEPFDCHLEFVLQE